MPGVPWLPCAPVVYVTGKGGVGKTTVAATIACNCSKQGQRAVLVEMEDGQAGERVLGRDRSHVAHEVLSYENALVETLGSLIGAKIIARALVSHHALRRLIGAVPALREFSYLDRIRAMASSKRYDKIIVDLPASGHALDWLRVPHAFTRFMGRSPLGSLGLRIHEEVIADGASEVVVVTLAEPLVVKETEQLCNRMKAELAVVPSLVVVNRIVHPDPDGAWEAADTIRKLHPEHAADANELLAILSSRGDQADDTAYAFGLARSMNAKRVISIPEFAKDPLAREIANWLKHEASS